MLTHASEVARDVCSNRETGDNNRYRLVSDSQYRCSRMVKSRLSHCYPGVSASFFLNSIASHFSSYPAWVTFIPARKVGSTTPFW